MVYGRDHTGAGFHTLEHCALLRKTVRVTCRRCEHVARFEAVQLWLRFHRRGWDGQLRKLGKHLFCGSCSIPGERQRSFDIAVTDEPAEQRDWPYPGDRVWKRLMSRYRA